MAETRDLQTQTSHHGLLHSILNTKHLEQVVPRLRPDLLHGLIQRCGLEDCGEILALATREQLMGVFDLDLWRAAQPGLDEHFDADRFGVWLEVLVEAGADLAAQKVAGMDVDLAITAFSQHTLVYDRAAVTPYETLDGEHVEPVCADDDRLTSDVGGYVLVARRADSWEAIVEVLRSLGAEHPDFFHRVMRGCRDLSNSGYEIDGLDDLLPEEDQALFDVATEREARREKQGYAAPAQARAFLQMARNLRLGTDAMPSANPLARAYFQALSETTTSGSGEQPASQDSAEAVAAVFALLLDAGIVSQPPPALPGGSEAPAPRLAHIRARLEFAFDQDQAASTARNGELAYLANTLMAGCSIQGRPFTAQEASDAALAVCNLGLENWPPQWSPVDAADLPISFLVDHDLVGVFQVGWNVLHAEVSMYAAEQLIGALKHLRCGDPETRRELATLRLQMTKHWRAGAPWQARDALEVIATLDMPAWFALLALIDECPALHNGLGASLDPRILSVGASAFEFISENSQIASVRDFMRSLPETLRS